MNEYGYFDQPYFADLLQHALEHPPKPDTINHIMIEHNDWCPALLGTGYCVCRSTVRPPKREELRRFTPTGKAGRETKGGCQMSVIPVRKVPTLGIPATTSRSGPAEASQAVTKALPNRTETPDPARHAWRCSMCASFDRSPYGYPLGLCAEHRNRIQHSSSEPAHFGCGTFEPKEVQS